MKAAALSFILPLALLASANAWVRESVLPAGTLLTCTMDEPNFSSATASVGDPVLCHPHGLQMFGQTVFPRGTYIVGHLADDKDPGHFWGKGFLKIEFDRIGLPGADLPLSAKMIAVSGGYKVDKEGKIKGKGHAKRDIVEWMLPPLWPWKILTLPARGPRPTLKGETRVTLRLMEDVIVPEAAEYQPFGGYRRPALYMRPRNSIAPPSGITAPAYETVGLQQGSASPSGSSARAAADDHSGWRSFRKGGAPATSTAPAQITPVPAATVMNDADDAGDTATPEKAPATDTTAATSAPAATMAPATAVPGVPAVSATPTITVAPAEPGTVASPPVTADNAGLVKTLPAENTPTATPAAVTTPKAKVTLFALRAGTVYAATDYWRDEDHLVYVTPNGKEGQVDMGDLDWKTTTQLNTDRNVKVTLREGK